MSIRAKYILLFLLGCGLAYSQPYVSRLGGFQVNQIKGCTPFTVTVTELLAAGFCTCSYNYEGSQVTTSKTYTFTQAGSYKITGTFQSGVILNAPGNTDDINIVVTPNIQPAFDISSCSAGQVSIKVTDSNYDQYLVDFNADNVVDNAIITGQTAGFTYGLIGVQAISVRGINLNAADNCNSQTNTFTPLAALPVATINTLTMIDPASIKLDNALAANVQYRVQIATNSNSLFQALQNVNSSSSTIQSLTVNNLTNESNYYCFRINAFDPCNNTSVPSNTICSADLDLTIQNNLNKVTWVTSTSGVTNFTVRRDQANYQNVIPPTTNFDDAAPNIVCNTNYCYSVTTNYPNGSRSLSLGKCDTAKNILTPIGIQNTSAVVSESVVDLTWIQDPLFSANSYSINRSEANGPFTNIGSSTATNFADNAYSTLISYCYQINYTDACANVSQTGNTVCPIRLSGFISGDNTAKLSWSAFTGWKDGVKRYQIDKFDNQGTFLETFTTTALNYDDTDDDPDHQASSYVVRALPNNITLMESVSNSIKLIKQARLIFPTAFTPNGDRLNENFSVVGRYVENMTLKIFDRWGTLLFSTDTNEPWDGTHNGKVMAESIYIWKAFITDKNGNTFTRIGSVALLRKGK
jgi:gliding motility-associated-like protein